MVRFNVQSVYKSPNPDNYRYLHIQFYIYIYIYIERERERERERIKIFTIMNYGCFQFHDRGVRDCMSHNLVKYGKYCKYTNGYNLAFFL